MTEQPTSRGAPLMLVRRILDEFCGDHGLRLSDANALDAATYLLSLAVAEQEAPETMRRSVEDWYLARRA